jgi:hypothetical protein
MTRLSNTALDLPVGFVTVRAWARPVPVRLAGQRERWAADHAPANIKHERQTS